MQVHRGFESYSLRQFSARPPPAGPCPANRTSDSRYAPAAGRTRPDASLTAGGAVPRAALAAIRRHQTEDRFASLSHCRDLLRLRRLLHEHSVAPIGRRRKKDTARTLEGAAIA